MSDPTPNSAQALLNIAGGILIGLLGLLYAIGGWIFTRHAKKVDDMTEKSGQFMGRDDLIKTFVTRPEIASLEVRMAETVSRKELIAHMDQLAIERNRMHTENAARSEEVRLDLLEHRKAIADATRILTDTVGKMNDRIDKIIDRIPGRS